jgi:hypothetical protein
MIALARSMFPLVTKILPKVRIPLCAQLFVTTKTNVVSKLHKNIHV